MVLMGMSPFSTGILDVDNFSSIDVYNKLVEEFSGKVGEPVLVSMPLLEFSFRGGREIWDQYQRGFRIGILTEPEVPLRGSGDNKIVQGIYLPTNGYVETNCFPEFFRKYVGNLRFNLTDSDKLVVVDNSDDIKRFYKKNNDGVAVVPGENLIVDYFQDFNNFTGYVCRAIVYAGMDLDCLDAKESALEQKNKDLGELEKVLRRMVRSRGGFSTPFHVRSAYGKAIMWRPKPEELVFDLGDGISIDATAYVRSLKD